MAGPTLFQVKRTSVAGREANTTYLPTVGEIGVNLTDGRMWVANSSNVFEVGANCNVSHITTSLSIGNSSANVTSNSTQINAAFIQAATAVYVGDNVDITTAGLFIGNTTVNLFANSIILKLANSTVNTSISVPDSIAYSATNYFLHANGSWVQVAGGSGSVRVYQSYTATGGQTTFTVSGGYTIGQIEVFHNGVHLANTEYTQNGSTVVLSEAALVGAIIEVSGWINMGSFTPAPSGSNTQIQFNDSGAFNGTAGLTFDKTTNNATIANTLFLGTGTANVIANTTIIKLANSTVNTSISVPTSAQYSGSYYLHANGTWALVSAGATPGGSNTQVQFNDSTALGGTAGFTFDKATNNAVVANTLTVGTATVNSTLAVLSALNVTNQVNTATLMTTGLANVNALNVTNQVNAATVVATTSMGVGNTTQNTTTFGITGNTTTAPSLVLSSNSTTSILYGNSTVTGTPTITVQNSTTNAILTSLDVKLGGTATVANTLGVYTPTVNAATHSVGALFTANATLVNAAAINITGQVNTATFNSTGAAAVGTTLSAGNTTVTGFVNATVSVNSALHSVGATFTANATLVNAAAINITGQVNTATFNSTGAAAVGTTLSAGNTTVTGFVNATVSVNSALLAVGALVTANSTLVNAPAINITGQVNTATLMATGLGNLNALNVTNQTNTATLFATTSANVGGNVQANTTTFSITGNTTTAPTLILSSNSTTAVVYGNTTITGAPSITLTNSISNSVLSSLALSLGGTTTVANTLGVYAPTVNAATHSVGALFTANSTLVNAAAINITGQVNTATLISTGLANLNALNVVNQTNTATLLSTGLANLNALNVTNQTNTATLFAATSANVGANIQANTTTFSITGNTTTAPTLILSSNSTTSILYGNSTITGTPTVTLQNSTTNAILTSLALNLGAGATVANTLGVYTTGTMNAAVFTTTGFRANVTHVVPTSNSSGQNFGNTISRWQIFANTIDITTTLTANGALGGATNILTSNSTGGVYWAAPSGGGNVTKVGTPADDQVGVWTGDGTIEGTVGFTFSAASNNAFIANTLTVGTATVNSTLANVSALNVINQVNAATVVATTSMGVGNTTQNTTAFGITGNTTTAPSLILSSNSTTSILYGNSTITGAPTITLQNSTTNAVLTSLALNLGTGATVANTLGVYTTGVVNAATHSVGTAFTANATLVNAAAINITGQVNTATFNSTGAAAVGTTLSAGNTTVTGFVNATVSVNSALLTVGTQFTANTTLANTVALNVVNQTNTATLFATTSANVGANVQANTTAFGITGNTTTAPSLAISSNSTAAVVYGNSSITGAPSILLTNSTSNAALTSAGIVVGNSTVNLFANSTALKLANSTVNTQITVPTNAQWTGSFFLHANGSWAAPTASAAAGGANTQVQFNDSTVIGGSAGFTFDKSTNNVTLANNLNVGANLDLSTSSLFVGNSTINTTVTSSAIAVNITGTANLTANSTLVQVANSTSTANLIPNSLTIGTSVVNSTMIAAGANVFIDTTDINAGNSTANLFANSILVKVANSTGIANLIPNALAINSVSFTGTTGLVTVSGGGLKTFAGNSTIAPLQFQSGTNLTTAVAGGVEFDGVQHYKTIDTSSGRGAVPVEQYNHLVANGATIGTIANFFGTTSNPTLVASANYIIEAWLWFLNTTAGTVTWTFTNSAAPTAMHIWAELTPVGGVTAAPGGTAQRFGQVSMSTTAAQTYVDSGTLTTAVNHLAHFKIFLDNGTGTSFKIQATKLVGGTITPLRGSYWFCRRMSPSNIGTFSA